MSSALSLRKPRRWLQLVLWSWGGVAGVMVAGWVALYLAATTTRLTLARAGTSWLDPLDSKWRTLSAGAPHSVQRVSAPSLRGEDSLRFELRPGETWRNHGERSFRTEIETRDTPPVNAVRWYRFALMLPPDFPIEDNRLVLVQWHGADKKYFGEAGRSPTLAFRYADGIFFLTLRHSAERIVRDADAVPSERLFKTDAFPLGEWNDFVVQAKWSFMPDGYVNVWWNGNSIVRYRGPVGYNDDVGPYLQFGLYRDDSPKTYVSYLNQFRGGNSAQEVGFVPPPEP